jgi:hypothetical protein
MALMVVIVGRGMIPRKQITASTYISREEVNPKFSWKVYQLSLPAVEACSLTRHLLSDTVTILTYEEKRMIDF